MRRLLFGCAVAVVAGAALIVLSAPPAPASPSAWTDHVGYQRSPRSGRWELWLVDAAGRQPRRIVANTYDNFGYTASPNGRLVAYVRDNAIYTMRPDGTHKRKIIGPPHWSGGELRIAPGLAWAPDGKRLAFTAEREDMSYGIFVSNLDGTDLRPLRGAFDQLWVGEPAWSSANEIAFARPETIWSIRADGSGLRRLVEGAGEHYSWSPKGDQLVFERSGGGLAVVDLTRNSQRLLAECGHEPVWKPWGDEIAFSTFACGGVRAEIWVVRFDGTGLRQLTNDRIPDLAPFWVKR